MVYQEWKEEDDSCYPLLPYTDLEGAEKHTCVCEQLTLPCKHIYMDLYSAH